MSIVIHCDECAGRLEIVRPSGIVVFNSDEILYHFVMDNVTLSNTNTICDRDSNNMDTIIGTRGIELSTDVLTNTQLQGRIACSLCFANVW